jgi:hypothetical protein
VHSVVVRGMRVEYLEELCFLMEFDLNTSF